MFHVSVIVPNATTVVYGILFGGMHPIMYVISDGGGGGGGGGGLYRGVNFGLQMYFYYTNRGAHIYLAPGSNTPCSVY